MKTCANCGSANRDTAIFCRSCAQRLPTGQPCPRCGRVNPPDAQFCNQCSYALAGVPAPPPNQTGLLSPQALLKARYRIVQRVGEGGMGAVYQAEDVRLPGKQWAIKEMSDAAITDPAERAEALKSFQQEAHLLATLHHPNLPKVMDAFEDGGKQYLVMEFVDGHTLEQIVEGTGKPLSESMALAIARDLCGVLAYLHGQRPPIIFRDLKPANIMIDRDGSIKLIDFGIARFFTPGKRRDTVALGTKGYAAPEQYGKGQTDARSDIFGLGATLHFLLTGRDPADDPLNFPPVRALNPTVSPQLNDAIMRAVAIAPEQRWASAADMLAALQGQARPAAQPVATPGSTSRVKTRSPSSGSPARPPMPVAPSSPRPLTRTRSPAGPAVPPSRPQSTPARPVSSAMLRGTGWFYIAVIGVLSVLNILLYETGILGALFPVVWFALSLLAGVLVREIGAISLTWLSIPLYNMVAGQANAYTWAEMVSLIAPIELFFLLTAHRYYTLVTMLLASGLGVLGLWVVANLGFNELALAAGAVAVGTVVAYLAGEGLEPLLT